MTQVRSSLLLSSRMALHELGYAAKYMSFLDEESRAAIGALVPGEWVGRDLARTHYVACDRMYLTTEEIQKVGELVQSYAKESVLKILDQLAVRRDATPWTVLESIPALTERMWTGGGVQVWAEGDRAACIRIYGHELMNIAYFRLAFRGVVKATLDAFAKNADVAEVADAVKPGDYTVRVTWA